jgi:hypothetical protein
MPHYTLQSESRKAHTSLHEIGMVTLTISTPGCVKMRQSIWREYFPECASCSRIQCGLFTISAFPIPPLNTQTVRYTGVLNLMHDKWQVARQQCN